MEGGGGGGGGGATLLADHGFDIKESVGLYCATVTIPAFTKGKKQLEGIEVVQTRTIIDNVRINIEGYRQYQAKVQNTKYYTTY